jgi:hypothetical protein
MGLAACNFMGYPGPQNDYKEWAPRHGQRVPFPPVGILGRPGWSEA